MREDPSGFRVLCCLDILMLGLLDRSTPPNRTLSLPSTLCFEFQMFRAQVALKVMGLSPGSSHTFELSGDVRDPTAVVLARVRKAQFAKEIRPGARRRRRRSSSRS